jgi:hypothetical protein
MYDKQPNIAYVMTNVPFFQTEKSKDLLLKLSDTAMEPDAKQEVSKPMTTFRAM